MKGYVYLAEGFEEVEALTVVDVLRRAGANVKTVAVAEEDSRLITGAHGIGVLADATLEECVGDWDFMVLPGGMPGTTNLGKSELLCNELKKAARRNDCIIAAICAAPMVLGKLGLLEGKRATIYPGMEEYLIGAEASEERVVVDGNIVTGRGPGAAMEFALALSGLLFGEEMQKNLIKDMVICCG